MKKLLILMIAILATLTLLSGCASGEKNLEGKYIATFVLSGGTLDYGASSVSSQINYAYEPNSYILDPSQIDGYTMYRNEYEFTGWYTSAECRPEEKYDFSKPITTENLTLYAGWEKSIVFSYTVCYLNGEEEVILGTYKVDAGEVFDDWRGYANTREDHTAVGFYADSQCEQSWDFTTAHPGGESDTDIRVYVKHIEGEWNLASNFEQLKTALKKGNVYLTNDIDCGGNALPIVDYKSVFEGNGHSIKNFTVEQKGTARTPAVAIFSSLSATAEIRNVTFEQVTFQLTDVKEGATPNVAVMAITADQGAKITSVSVQGTLQTNYQGQLAYDVAVFKGNVELTNFTAEITLEQTQ